MRPYPILTILREGTTEKPKFEQDMLECRNSINHLKEIQKFFQGEVSRQDVKKVSALATELHHKSGQPEMRKKTSKLRKEIEKFAERHFVQEGKNANAK